MQIFCYGWKGQGGVVCDYCIGGFGEEEWLLVIGIVVYFVCMIGVVLVDVEDVVYWEVIG